MTSMRRSSHTTVIAQLALSLLVLGGLGGTAAANTITVNVTSGPSGRGCNLADAIKAATTNRAVNGCGTGSTNGGADTIRFSRAGTYTNYGAPLLVPTTGGSLTIQGVSSLPTDTIILAPNYGFPNPNPMVNIEACPYGAAIYTGGTLTLTNVALQSAPGAGMGGVCQYAGGLTLSGALIGDTGLVNGFTNGGGIISHPNTTTSTSGNNHRTIALQNGAVIWGNATFGDGGGLMLWGDVAVTMTSTTTTLQHNSALGFGGAIAWEGVWGKMGNITITGPELSYNVSQTDFPGGGGGAMYLAGDDPNATVTINDGLFEQNECSSDGGGAIWVGGGMGTDKLILTNFTAILNNLSLADRYQNSFVQGPAAYAIISCRGSSSVDSMRNPEWSPHNPPLKGDGTCQYP